MSHPTRRMKFNPGRSEFLFLATIECHYLKVLANRGASIYIACDPEADEAGVGEHVVHPIGHDLAALLILEVVDVNAPRLAFWTIICAALLEVADQFLFFRVHRDDRLLPDL